ncbi:prohibitin family protein [Pseudorhodoplanes sp.]|uniref:prohibitin family protein n=1 Tax=Pseudorhodoplanes sp. TaxID=1934341 RepID=UPI002C3767AA|nr:SPFH domain-containing protein [Pseudorhodoplanes sp.]HWV52535.1 SPFH domain-containing protein [Pseudorhodoplanes sp.]
MATYPESLDGNPPVVRKRGAWNFLTRRLPSFAFMLLVLFLAVTVLWRYIVITVPSGHVGVLWKRFNTFDYYCWCFAGRGTMLNPQQLRGEGLHLVWPWDRLFIYNLRLQSTAQTYNAISRDGVNVTIQMNIRYQLLHNAVAVLHKFIGPEYFNSVVSPEIGSQTRQVIAQYTAQEVYTSREAIQEKVRDNARKGLGANLNKLVQPEAMEQPDPKNYNDALQYSIQIIDTLVLSIELPPAIVAAINRQTEQFYLIQEYRYRVEREAQESRRKQIEANGIAAFQQTVSQGISDSYLRWRGIEATLALSQSPNSKIVVIGGRDGLPIILGNVDQPAGPPTPPRKDAAVPAPTDTVPGAYAAPQAVPTVSSPTTVFVQPGGAVHVNPPGTPPQPPAPAAPDKKSAAEPAAPAKPDKAAEKPATFNPFDLSSYESVLSRITGGSRTTGSSNGSEGPPAEAKMKPAGASANPAGTR